KYMGYRYYFILLFVVSGFSFKTIPERMYIKIPNEGIWVADTLLRENPKLLTYGNRKPGEFGVAIKISKDEGKSWGQEYIVIDDLGTGDSGYPSSIQLPDGRIMTAFYSNKMAAHQ